MADRVQRIALLSLHSSPLAPLGRADAGGLNLYVGRLADELSHRGRIVDIFTRRTDTQSPDVVPLASGARLIHLSAGPHRRLPKAVLPLHLPSMVSAFRAFMAAESIRYDVLHSHYWLSGMAAARFRVQDDDTIPFIHMFHTLTKLKEFYSGEPDRDDSALRFDGERCLISRADAIVGATGGELEDMSRLYGRDPARYSVIPPGVDLDSFSPLSQADSRIKLGIHANRVILFVGRFDRLKGLEVLLHSVAGLPTGIKQDLKVVLVGGVEADAGTSRYHRLARTLGLDKMVMFRGKVAQSELPSYYSAADVCAVPSAYESFGMVALEAMACQTPPVAFCVGGLAATITDGRTGLLAPAGNADAFSARLQDAFTGVNLDEIGRRARIAVQRYTWDLTAERTLGLYETVARERRYASTRQYATS